MAGFGAPGRLPIVARRPIHRAATIGKKVVDSSHPACYDAVRINVRALSLLLARSRSSNDEVDMASQKSATIKDVAKEAGVSLMTVSAVLSGKAAERRISKDTQDRVEEMARLL